MNPGKRGANIDAPSPSTGMTTIHYRGRLAALADHDRVALANDIQALPDGHPDKRFIAFMCLYARDIHTGALPGPYRDSDAERYARTCLIDTQDPEQLSELTDDQAAAVLGVPAAHLTAYRHDQEPHMTRTRSSKAPVVAARPRTRAEQLRDLWAMTADQRIAAMRRGELSLYACCAWAARHPDQVPRIHTGDSAGGEFEFLAQHTE